MVEGNGDNRFWIEIKCKHEVTDVEWLEVLLLLNRALGSFDEGRLDCISAYLCEDE